MVKRLVPFLFAPNCVFLDLIFNEKYINETKNSDSPDSNGGPIIALYVFILWLKSKLIEVPNYFFLSHTDTHTHIDHRQTRCQSFSFWCALKIDFDIHLPCFNGLVIEKSPYPLCLELNIPRELDQQYVYWSVDTLLPQCLLPDITRSSAAVILSASDICMIMFWSRNKTNHCDLGLSSE